MESVVNNVSEKKNVNNENLDLTFKVTDFLTEDFHFFISQLLSDNICQKKHLVNYLANQKKTVANNNGLYDIEGLAVALVQSNLTNEQQIRPIFRELHRFRARFGRLGINLGKFTFEDVRKALNTKNAIYQKGRKNVLIGKVLAHYGLLNPDDTKNILEEQKMEIDRVLTLKDYEIFSFDDFKNLEPKVLISNQEKSIISIPPQSSNVEILANDNTCLMNENETLFDKINLCVSSHKMQAQILELKDKITIQSLKAELNRQGIVFGIVSDEELQAFIEKPVFPFTVAKGKVPRKNVPTQFKDKTSYVAVKKGSTDIVLSKNLDSDNYDLLDIKANSTLRIVSLAKRGEFGIDIYGQAFPSRELTDLDKQDDLVLAHGDNIEVVSLFDKNGTDTSLKGLNNKIDGVVCQDETGKMVLINNVVIKDLVSFPPFEESIASANPKLLFGKKTACNVNLFKGIKNASVHCQNLESGKSVENCKIIANNLNTTDHIIRSVLVLQGDLKAFMLEYSDITVKGKINVAKNISNCKINCDSLKAVKVFNSHIKIKNGLHITQELNSADGIIEVFSEDIFDINEKILHVQELETVCKELEKMINNEKKTQKIIMDCPGTLNEVMTGKKSGVVLKTVTNTASPQKKIFLSQIQDLNLPEIKTLDLHDNDNLLLGLKAILKKQRIDLLALNNQFDESRLNPIIKIRKIVGNIVIKSASKEEIKLTSNLLEANIYEEKQIMDDGTYKTVLIQR